MIRAQPGKRPAIGPGSRKVSPNSFATGRIPRVRLPAMPSGGSKARLGEPTRSSRRTGGYSSVDSWIREMPKSKRRITWIGYLLQGYAIYCLWTRSLVWPLMWPNEILVFLSAVVMYWVGGNLMNRMLTSEFVRKTQLEADQVAARQIQRTLTPIKVDEVPGYEVETFYKPLRDVGGDYFDVIELGDKRTLFAIADVSGKGMPAALLAANITGSRQKQRRDSCRSPGLDPADKQPSQPIYSDRPFCDGGVYCIESRHWRIDLCKRRPQCPTCFRLRNHKTTRSHRSAARTVSRSDIHGRNGISSSWWHPASFH